MNQGEATNAEGHEKRMTWMGRPMPLAKVYWRHHYREALMKAEGGLGQAADEARRIDVSAGVEQELRAMRERVRALLLAVG